MKCGLSKEDDLSVRVCVCVKNVRRCTLVMYSGGMIFTEITRSVLINNAVSCAQIKNAMLLHQIEQAVNISSGQVLYAELRERVRGGTKRRAFKWPQSDVCAAGPLNCYLYPRPPQISRIDYL